MGFGEFIKTEKEKAREGFDKIKKDYTEKRMVENWKKDELKKVSRDETWKERVKITKKQAREKTKKKYSKPNTDFIKKMGGNVPKTSNSGFDNPLGNKGKGGNAFDW